MDLDFDFRPGENLPESALHRLRDAGPVAWSDNLSGWLVTAGEEVRRVLGDVTRFTSAGTPVAETFTGEGMLVDDTPMHHTLRGVWTKSVSAAAMKARIEELSGFAASALDSVEPRLKAGETVDFIPVFREFVMNFIASSFAVPRSRLDVFLRWSEMSADTPALAMEQDSEAQRRHAQTKAEVIELVRGEVADRRARIAAGEQPGDLTALMVAAEGLNGITPTKVVDNLFNFILGAMDTTEKWLGNIVVRLCSDPALRAQVAADAALLEPLADEVMRFHTVAQVIQRRVKDGGVELGGQALAAGDVVYVMLGAANRDPATFPDPDRFDVRRRPTPNFGFGFGFHHCLGINIAKAEVTAFIATLLQRLPPLRVVEADFGKSWALLGPRRLELALAD